MAVPVTDATLSGRPIRVFHAGQMRRDFTYIDEIVFGVLAALGRPPPPNRTIKAGGSCAPCAIDNLGNHRAEAPEDVIAAVGGTCGIAATHQLKPMQPSDVPATYAGIEQSARHLCFAPRTTIRGGVPRLVHWFRQTGGTYRQNAGS